MPITSFQNEVVLLTHTTGETLVEVDHTRREGRMLVAVDGDQLHTDYPILGHHYMFGWSARYDTPEVFTEGFKKKVTKFLVKRDGQRIAREIGLLTPADDVLKFTDKSVRDFSVTATKTRGGSHVTILEKCGHFKIRTFHFDIAEWPDRKEAGGIAAQYEFMRIKFNNRFEDETFCQYMRIGEAAANATNKVIELAQAPLQEAA